MARLNALPRPEQFAEAQRRLDEARRRLAQNMSDDQAWADYLAALDAVYPPPGGKPPRGFIWTTK